MDYSLTNTVQNGLDIEFYGIWYEDLHHLNAMELEEHWESYGKGEGRFENAISFSRAMFWPISSNKWREFLDNSDGSPRAVSREQLLEKIQNRLISDSGEVRNPVLRSLEFDPTFYKSWYKDLSQFSDDQLKHHWTNNGKNELRFGCFRTMVEAEGLSVDDLPAGFDPEGYMALNKSIKQKQIDIYKLAYDFLAKGKAMGRSYFFDPFFYAAFYKDLSGLHSPMSLLAHYKKYGAKEKRYPNIQAFLQSRGGDALLDYFGIDFMVQSILDRNPHLNCKGIQDILVLIIGADKVERIALFEKESENADLYADLGVFLMNTQERNQAIKAFYTSLSFRPTLPSYEGLGLLYAQNDNYLQAYHFLSRALSMGSQRHDVINQLLEINKESYSFDDINSVLKVSPTYNAEDTLASISDRFWSDINAENKVLATLNDRTSIASNISNYATTVREQFSSYYQRFSDGKPLDWNINLDRVAIIGDQFIPQCIRYRIDQKVSQLAKKGVIVKSIAWNDSLQSLKEAVLFSDIIIFYRCPAMPILLQIVEKAKALGKVCIYDIDDLIFSKAYPPPSATYGAMVDEDQYTELVRSFPLYAEMAKACHYALASTIPLADKLNELVQFNRTYVHRNALDQHSVIRSKNHSNDKKTIDLFYGSATLAHNSDFTSTLLPVLVDLLKSRTDLRLVILGHLKLGHLIPADINEQVKTLPYISDTGVYLEVLGQSDINLAVLDRDAITDGKSEIKWLEAGAMGIPSVVSETANYLDVIKDGETGYIALSSEEWKTKLTALIESADLRNKIGANAKAFIEKEYSEQKMSDDLHAALMVFHADFKSKQDD